MNNNHDRKRIIPSKAHKISQRSELREKVVQNITMNIILES